jgi:hypothetical protein
VASVSSVVNSFFTTEDTEATEEKDIECGSSPELPRTPNVMIKKWPTAAVAE